MAKETAFFAYPNDNPLVKDAIHGAAEKLSGTEVSLALWEKINILGFKLDDLIREKIGEADVLVADITYPNHNVFYEIGYAISFGKPVLPAENTAIRNTGKRIIKIGLFDTTGYAGYSNAIDLSSKISEWKSSSWINRFGKKRDHSQPLFVLDSYTKTDFRNWIFQAVDDSGVNFRHFDPEQIPRLSAAQAYAEISSSAGAIIPIVSPDLVDSDLHNLRAAFLLGLAHGAAIDTLCIQYDNGPAPLDYRDFIRNSDSRRETTRHVEEFCQQTLIRNQRADPRGSRDDRSLLNEIDLGSSFAENENQQLYQYFIETAEYSRAIRAEGAVIVGRKGSGKTAVYLQAAEYFKSKVPRDCVVDLRPASHNLSEMREALIGVASAGIFDHTIAAFWRYILYTEVLLKLRELLLEKSKNDYRLQLQIANIEENLKLTDGQVSSDFTSRLDTAVKLVIEKTRETSGGDLREKLTNILFEKAIPIIRSSVVELSEHFGGIVILLDDLDKGWPPRRVEVHDVTMIKHLLEAMNGIRRDLGKRDVDFSHLLFIRSDIYERLVEETSDRGKYNVISVDWSDREQLRHLLKVRVSTSVPAEQHDEAWSAFNPPMASGDAVEKLISASLMRPRFLIDLSERTLSFAINRGRSSVIEADVDEAIAQMSLYLVSDFGYELRDVAGTPEDIFYLFIGVGERLTSDQLHGILSGNELGLGVDETINLLLWYGFLGIISSNGSPTFIYDRSYDFRRLEAERSAAGKTVVFIVNPAFLRGL